MKSAVLFRSSIRCVQGLFYVTACCLAASGLGRSQAAEFLPASAILQDLRGFRELGTVLHIAAHPDDENTRLITYLARGRQYRTAYLSLTRGDGGQNVLGPEFGEELGVIRTQELLAARRIDGGRQFFTRAIDFGFSKDYRETLNLWDKQQVLSDMVRIIREFRPDVLVTRFSTTPGGNHGHHTASAVLALEAFKLAADTNAFPEQLRELKPWQPKRILLSGGGRGGGAGNASLLRLEAGGTDALSGESFSALAGRSRSMHKTQGFGNFGGGGGGGPVSESFQFQGGEPATKDILDGVDTTWDRVTGGAEVGKMADEIITQFNSQDPAAIVPALLKLRGLLAALPADRLVDEKRLQLDRILQACLGLSVKTETAQAEVVPGEAIKLRHSAIVRSSIPIRWMAVRYPNGAQQLNEILAMPPNQAVSREVVRTLPANTPLSQPYWLKEEHSIGMYRVAETALIGRPENPPAYPIEHLFEVNGQTLMVPDEPVQTATESAKTEARRLEVVAPVSLKFLYEVRLFAPGTTRPVEVEVAALRAGVTGTLQLETPAGWKVTPASQPFRLASVGERARFTFNVEAPNQPTSAGLIARAEVNGARYDNQRVEIHYNHIPRILLQPPARLKAVCLEMAIRGRQVGYLPGAGDSVAEGLEQMGYQVTSLTGADLTAERLSRLDAVVIGIRAFNVRKDLTPGLPALFAYVEAGGNVIVQYNRPESLQSNRLAPFDLRLSQSRVTDENAAVTFLEPEHPALNLPNKITAADFEGWVQERGVYFPNQWDEHFTPIIACGDPGETPLKGGLLVARLGKGYFVYTGLAWFRQLPAGVPGAYRFFANLVSLGK